ncbi:DGC [Acididesulfobacillus acetoxydans]|uniref:DGC n=1 Tax=Acididesulfobacillus acetoxydans TaxID=1561005 RepID=A0A8S0WYJ3_9FIRM|nr:putative zinc-binding protein [Acididesulfobacillus acetoxydans]CAA7601521.1 DGC [Acididesulfobacillus acetoxydans]CEJ07008.1 Glycine cleavage system H protein-like protein [Acididesulfobacillus acetoxydans]
MMKRWGILPCNGLDKPAGQLAREIALYLAQDQAKTLACPVFLHSAPSVYAKVKEETQWLVLDGCNTRCASKLAAEAGFAVGKKINVSELTEKENLKLGRSLRLEPEALALAKRSALDLAAALFTARTDREEKTAAIPDGKGQTDSGVDFPASITYTEFRQDKFRFRVPQGEFFFNENDCWVWVQGQRARVGVSDYVQQSLSDIIFFSAPELGAEVEQFGVLGSLESSKAVFEVIAPVAGKVVAVNEELEGSPERVNENPYEQGWIAEVELTDWETDRELLLDAGQYLEYLKNKVADFHV